MRRRNWIGTAALLVAGLGGVAGACFSERGPTDPTIADCNLPVDERVVGSVVVVVRDFEFVPREIRVAPGTKVTWINCGPDAAHTATSDTRVFDSPLLAPGRAFTYTFTQAGTFPYFCVPHPFMRATVIVQ